MCGRYVRRGSKQKIAEYFHANLNPLEQPMPDADYSVTPTIAAYIPARKAAG